MLSAHSLIDQLTSLSPLKTWSFIMTVFGDLDGDSLSGKQIRTILGAAGIRPEAARVALHRLKNDGWIDTTKTGREVVYRLSDYGIAETQAVYPDIYRRDVKYPDGWRLQLVDQDEATDRGADPGLRLARNLRFVPVERLGSDVSAMDLTFEAQSIPDWFVARIAHPDIVAIADRLGAVARAVKDDHGAVEDAEPPMRAAVIRLLILHHWRKMALRDATWAHIALFPSGAMAACHQSVTSLLDDLPRPRAEDFS